MTELRNTEREISRFRLRLLAAALFVLVAFGLLVARLSYLQVAKHEDLSTQAENNRIAVVPITPNRGLILDRNGVVLANNYSAYTLEIQPGKVSQLDKTIDELAEVVEIQPRDRKRFKRMLEESKSVESLPIRTRLSDEEVARFTAQKFRFDGVEIKARLFRSYPLGEVGSHLIGYIGRINEAEQEKIDDSDDEANYRGTQYIGKLGVEQSYEEELHGTTGFEEVEMSAGGHAVRRLKSNPATPGNAVVLSIDVKLQAMVEELFGDRRGALVAIDPRNGEVLAFVSKPNFDPNLFVDGIDAENWKALNESPDKPLLNRALRGAYPPGSTVKPLMALAGLEYSVIDPGATRYCHGYYQLPGSSHHYRDWKKEGHGSVDMRHAIAVSCDVYFYGLAELLGIERVHDALSELGFGAPTGIDIGGERPGLVPSAEWKEKTYKQTWYPGDTIIVGIGQGYLLVTPLQLAHAAAIVAAHGQNFRPRLVVGVRDAATGAVRKLPPVSLPPVALKDPKAWDVVVQGMEMVTEAGGTAVVATRGAGYKIAGKTGTAQVFNVGQNEKYDEKKVPERLRDHALFIAFAPAEDPKLAVAVLVENGGHGSSVAAPIARRVFDAYLLGKYDAPATPPPPAT